MRMQVSSYLAGKALVGFAAVAAVLCGSGGVSEAGNCAYGSATCRAGYVWREAYSGDMVCVTPDQRDQAAADNMEASSRVDPYGAYGPNTCVSGYVWREASSGDLVCVEPWVRNQVGFDNAQAAARVEPGCYEDRSSGATYLEDDEPAPTRQPVFRPSVRID